MAEILGTPRRDVLVGTDEADLIRGGRGEDEVYGGLGDDILYGGDGNDYIGDRGGRSLIYGGRGSDLISIASGAAYGGRGNDTIVCGDASWATGGAPGAAAVGGVGNDFIRGSGFLFGDQSPGMDAQPGGNDRLDLIADEDGVWANGGLGQDTFMVESTIEGEFSSATIADFTPGVDKLLAFGNWHDVPENLFYRLDATRDGILDWQDSPAGGAVYTDGVNLFLGLNATVADPSLTDATCWLTLNNVTQISAADWLFPPEFD